MEALIVLFIASKIHFIHAMYILYSASEIGHPFVMDDLIQIFYVLVIGR